MTSSAFLFICFLCLLFLFYYHYSSPPLLSKLPIQCPPTLTLKGKHYVYLDRQYAHLSSTPPSQIFSLLKRIHLGILLLWGIS
ncbi:hypothetical protein F4775DRAFT_554617 [Biscogniauxia sp. FL1348]|nr:hypothetical protein F4775DRAFT_554617 [Biscogniauxia sp. FL1348]